MSRFQMIGGGGWRSNKDSFNIFLLRFYVLCCNEIIMHICGVFTELCEVYTRCKYFQQLLKLNTMACLRISPQQRATRCRDPIDSSITARPPHYLQWWLLVAVNTCLIASSAGIFKQSMGARNRVGIRLSYRPARLHSLAELVPWSRF